MCRYGRGVEATGFPAPDIEVKAQPRILFPRTLNSILPRVSPGGLQAHHLPRGPVIGGLGAAGLLILGQGNKKGAEQVINGRQGGNARKQGGTEVGALSAPWLPGVARWWVLSECWWVEEGGGTLPLVTPSWGRCQPSRASLPPRQLTLCPFAYTP